ncbi:MAG TPA: VanW family protein [Candidatus Limnocylindrales bacterium]|nr:VanW family protein [Candidatus Limnocylindrales bacterium]
MAVSEETLPAGRSVHVPHPGRRLVLFVAAAMLGGAAVVGGLAVYHESLAGRLLPGISAAGVDIGGLSPDAAKAVLDDRSRALAAEELVLRTANGSTTLPFAAVSRAADVDAMVAEAAAIGRGGTWLDETIAAIRTSLEPRAVGLRLTFDPEKASAAVRAFAGAVAIAPIDAATRKTPTAFVVDPAVDGRQIDIAATTRMVDAELADPRTASGSVVDPPIVTAAAHLTTAAAEAARDAALRMSSTHLQLRSGSKTWTLYGGRIRTWLDFGWVDGVYGPTIDQTAIPDAFATIGKRVARPVHDAALLRDKRGRVVGAEADSAGCELDVPGAVAAVVQALHDRAGGTPADSVELPLRLLVPATRTADVTKHAPLMVRVGSWTTHYDVSAHNGFGANITVPTRTLNGTVVQPGAVFDFWGALGEVSFRTGYRLGGAIVGGHSVEGKALAGGICAASTTLFNAALRGGYEIDARQPHWYYITRYPLGLDATVSGSQTMRFRNDTRYPILIRGFAGPGIVRFEIWSVPNGRTVTLTRPIVTNVVPGYDTTVPTASLPKGSSQRTEWPVDGKDVSVTRIVRDASGRIVHEETYVSHYHRMVGINMVGIG